MEEVFKDVDIVYLKLWVFYKVMEERIELLCVNDYEGLKVLEK